MRKINLEYKNGMINFNVNNFLKLNTWEDVEQHFLLWIDDAKREKNIQKKCAKIQNACFYLLGKYLTFECFEDILDYCGIDYMIFEGYINFLRVKIKSPDYYYKWFYDLKNKYYFYRSKNGR